MSLTVVGRDRELAAARQLFDDARGEASGLLELCVGSRAELGARMAQHDQRAVVYRS